MGDRKCFFTFSDTIDNLTVQQIKEVYDIDSISEYEKEISDLMHDIGVDIDKKDMVLDSKMITLIILLSQINLFIWIEKEKMINDKNKYYDHLKLSHQLNGYRNQVKNLIEDKIGSKDVKTNTDIDGLKGWNIKL